MNIQISKTGGESVKSLFLFPKEKFLYMISSGVPVSEGIGQSFFEAGITPELFMCGGNGNV